jgi:phage gpG-like protein
MAKKSVVVDKGFKQAVEGLRALFTDVEVVVGIMGAEAVDREPGDDLNLVEIAAVHEFGAPSRNIPQRSFLAATFEEKQQQLAETVMRLADKISRGRIKFERVHEQLGLLGEKWVREKIDSRISPPLKKATIQRKGSSKPLFDTGRLYHSIRYEVRNK